MAKRKSLPLLPLLLGSTAVLLTLVFVVFSLLAAPAGAEDRRPDLPYVIEGVVLTDKGAGLGGVTVTLSTSSGIVIITTTTAATGHYSLDVGAGSFFDIVRATHPAYRFEPPSVTSYVPPSIRTVNFVAITNPAGAYVIGNLLTQERQPITDGAVQALATSGAISTANRGPNGVYLLPDLVPGAYTITATSPTHAFPIHSAQTVVVPPSRRDINLIGYAHPTVNGAIRNSTDLPLSDVNVHAQSNSSEKTFTTQTDANGVYTLHLPAGNAYTVAPLARNYVFTPTARYVAVPPSVSSVDFTAIIEYRSFIYMPAMHTAPDDLAVRHIEVTQATQTSANNVPLVANRPTIVRVFAATTGKRPAPDILLRLAAFRDGQLIGDVLQGLAAVTAEPSRGIYTNTYNIRLPNAWLSGNVELEATIDANGAFTELDESNNTFRMGISFQELPPFVIRLVPINYTDAVTGEYFAAVADIDDASFVPQVFPVGQMIVELQSPLSFQGDLRNRSDWDRLLSQVLLLSQVDGAPDAYFYYGLVPVTQFSFPLGGLGYIFTRAAIGVDNAHETLAHELGHNLRLYHAPCGDPANTDPDYPYPDGRLGEFGVDVLADRLLTPDDAYDLMSYCWRKWISDYHYVKAFEEQLRNGYSRWQQPVPGMHVRMAPTDAGGIAVLPAYSLNAPPTALPAQSEYAIELVDGQGIVLASHPVSPAVASEEGFTTWVISAVLPQPALVPSLVRLTHQGQLVAERKLVEPRRAAVNVTASDDGAALTWRPADRPALVRYSTDDGATWTTLGVDVTGGSLTLPHTVRNRTDVTWGVLLGR